MKKEQQDPERRARIRMFHKVAPVVGALVLAIVSVVYIVCRTLNNRAYHEKWKDYDECGLG